MESDRRTTDASNRSLRQKMTAGNGGHKKIGMGQKEGIFLMSGGPEPL